MSTDPRLSQPVLGLLSCLVGEEHDALIEGVKGREEETALRDQPGAISQDPLKGDEDRHRNYPEPSSKLIRRDRFCEGAGISSSVLENAENPLSGQ